MRPKGICIQWRYLTEKRLYDRTIHITENPVRLYFDDFFTLVFEPILRKLSNHPLGLTYHYLPSPRPYERSMAVNHITGRDLVNQLRIRSLEYGIVFGDIEPDKCSGWIMSAEYIQIHPLVSSLLAFQTKLLNDMKYGLV